MKKVTETVQDKVVHQATKAKGCSHTQNGVSQIASRRTTAAIVLAVVVVVVVCFCWHKTVLRYRRYRKVIVQRLICDVRHNGR